MSYAQVQGIPLGAARAEVDFPFVRENLITEENNYGAGRDAIVRTDEEKSLGIISKKRAIVPYADIMDWVVDEFTGSSIPFKLKNSVITSKGELHQEYLFDFPFEAPDDEDIAPRVVVKGSYIGRPLEIAFGTYRFVCSNGALVGNTFESIILNSRDISGMSNFMLREDIKRGLDSMDSVSKKYKTMIDTPH
jgi:hypothetical protein